ncbi:MAG: TolC family protein [Candidatus Hydrogenedentota bacterium]
MLYLTRPPFPAPSLCVLLLFLATTAAAQTPPDAPAPPLVPVDTRDAATAGQPRGYAPPAGMDPEDVARSLREFEAEDDQTPPFDLEEPVVIGVVSAGPRARESLRERFRKEIDELLVNTGGVRFPDRFQLQGDWTWDGVNAALDQLLEAPEVDIVLAFGVIASTAAARRGPLPKPAIAAHIVDREALGIPMENGGSGVRNLAYISAPSPVARDIRAFHELIPFDHLSILVSEELLACAPELERTALAAGRDLGIEITITPVADDAMAALAEIPASTGAVYLGPLFQLADHAFDTLVNGLIARDMPSFSLSGVDEVRRGVLATLQPPADDTRRARRMALYVHRIVRGEQPEALPVSFPQGRRLTLNMATARAIGYQPSWTVLSEALLINEESEEAVRVLTLNSVVDRALSENRDLRAKEQAVTAGEENIPAAWAKLKPQVEAAGTGTFIDEDLASPLQPEHVYQGSVKVRQLIYDDKAWANVYISKRLQKALEHEYAGRELDIIQFAAQAYFNVLRAKTFERIQKDNLRLTRKHLELAQVRHSVGTGNPGEVYRWESELASARIDVMNASAKRAAAALDLNRILHLPQEDAFDTQEAGLDDSLLAPTRSVARNYLDNPRTFTLFRDFMVEEGLARAPELRRLDQVINAKERAQKAARRAYYMPTVGVEGEVLHDFRFSGAGSEGGIIRYFLPGTEEDTTWSIGVQASIPIYAGGARKAARIQTREEVAQLQLERVAAQEKIEERVRVAAHEARASFANIAHAEAASDAARKNLELVADAYGRGVVSVIDLLDAQNAALVAKLSAAGARFQFFMDLMELERAAARFSFRMDEDAHADWLGRLRSYFSAQGVTP